MKYNNLNLKVKFENSNKNIEIFKLEPLYNYHVDEVKELILKRYIYYRRYIDQLKLFLEGTLKVNISNQQLIEFIVNNIIDKTKLHERTLSKLYKDTVEQLEFLNDDFNTDNIDDLLNILNSL